MPSNQIESRCSAIKRVIMCYLTASAFRPHLNVFGGKYHTLDTFWLSVYMSTVFALLENGSIWIQAAECEELKIPVSISMQTGKRQHFDICLVCNILHTKVAVNYLVATFFLIAMREVSSRMRVFKFDTKSHHQLLAWDVYYNISGVSGSPMCTLIFFQKRCHLHGELF